MSQIHPTPYDVVVDVGAGGNAYDLPHNRYVHVDIAFERLRGCDLGVCADGQALPLRDGVADCILCVGPVVNYCSLVEVVSEASRIAKPHAHFLFHVELSNSCEFLFTKHFRADATFVSTFYQGDEPLWVYSDRNVRQTLRHAGFTIRHVRYLHIASGLAYRICKNSDIATEFTLLDLVLRHVPGIGSFADGGLFTCEKIP